jgi:putative ABC transport system permease protein
MTVSFFEPTSFSAVYEISSLPGVEEVEPFRSVPVCLRVGNRSYHTAVIAGPEDARLKRLLTESGSPIRMPLEGLMITRKLGELLGLKIGDPVMVEVLEGRRPKLNLAISAFSDELFGASGYTTLGNLDRWMGDGELVSGFYMRTDPAFRKDLLDELKRRPRVAGISERDAMLKSFEDVMAQNMLVFAGILVLFAAAIAIGVVYNNARVSLAEKERELATLRVIGMTRGEVSLIMLGEMVFELVFALPLGCLIGWTLAKMLAVATETDLYRLPVVILPKTYMLAMGIVVATSIVTAFIVRRRIDRLDLVEVLKSKE